MSNRKQPQVQQSPAHDAQRAEAHSPTKAQRAKVGLAHKQPQKLAEPSLQRTKGGRYQSNGVTVGRPRAQQGPAHNAQRARVGSRITIINRNADERSEGVLSTRGPKRVESQLDSRKFSRAQPTMHKGQDHKLSRAQPTMRKGQRGVDSHSYRSKGGNVFSCADSHKFSRAQPTTLEGQEWVLAIHETNRITVRATELKTASRRRRASEGVMLVVLRNGGEGMMQKHQRK
ncbi:hypothetical protein K435DRAFT_837864 [Dendrothele bispora CBS 962.96]|uniref:Uncharacterized protein n=1 Tax=Dendrothele bispora (strain CBS 962.96) TaxID=1314807 RepID=A0A4S8MAL3_DENBC|nr:hypothetical protein K435DRAFT_837864 [Dendrothele bispora CBS 962.96]